MSVEFVEKITTDGRKFEETLKELSSMQLKVGFQRGTLSDDGVDIADIAAFNELGTSNGIPSRPFLRDSVDNHVDEINAEIDHAKNRIMAGDSAEKILGTLGMFLKDLVQTEIIEGTFEPNAERTIKKKKSAKPLIDTGRMRQSVNYVIQKKGD